MAIATRKFVRKPLYVEAVRITQGNFAEVAEWCGGVIEQKQGDVGGHKTYIKVPVEFARHVRQTQGFIGDWILVKDGSYKIYTNKAFRQSFDEAAEPQPGDLSDSRLTGNPIVDAKAEQTRGMDRAEFDAVRRAEELQELQKLKNASVPKERPVMQVVPPGVLEDDVVLIPATPQNIADEVRRQEELRASEVAQDVPGQRAAITPDAAAGKRVLSEAEQREMTSDQVRELVQSGEAVLAQDLRL